MSTDVPCAHFDADDDGIVMCLIGRACPAGCGFTKSGVVGCAAYTEAGLHHNPTALYLLNRWRGMRQHFQTGAPASGENGTANIV
ncbi:MAG: hypothetical protein V2I51_05410 [Anderseniella sp.]|nr:hypothetical protein [Anderseniella sp.]